MRVLFLDFDGVLNTLSDHLIGAPALQAKKVQLLNELSDLGVSVVISSLWKHDHTFEELKEILEKAGLEFPVIAVTPNMPRKFSDFSGVVCRAHEIQAWLKFHPEVTGYAVLDDLPVQSPGLVQTSRYRGLCQKHLRPLREKLEKVC